MIDSGETALAAWLPLLPQGVSLATAPPEPDGAYLFPEEALYVAGATIFRRSEFTTGRALARLALVKLGISPQAITRDSGRRPRWPLNTVGSITHCDGLVAVAVATKKVVRSLGIDAERRLPLEERIVSRICTEREIRWSAEAPVFSGDWPRMMFSAKESIYKNVSSLFGTPLGFQDVSVLPDPEDGSFGVVPESQSARMLPWERFSGRYGVTEAHIVTAGFFKLSSR